MYQSISSIKHFFFSFPSDFFMRLSMWQLETQFFDLLRFKWHTFSRWVTARWSCQRAKNQVLTNQNSRNRWGQIVRRTICYLSTRFLCLFTCLSLEFSVAFYFVFHSVPKLLLCPPTADIIVSSEAHDMSCFHTQNFKS